MSDHDETAADQEERRDDVPPSDPDDERWRMRNPEDESPPNEGGESQQPA